MDHERLAERFEEQRPQLRGAAYRILGSLSEADDALQEAWLRVSRSDTSDVENLGGLFTTVVGRVALNMLRSRHAKREEPLDAHVPDPIVSLQPADPEQQALITDSVGLAMLVVLDALAPAERVAFVLHDTFAVPFDEIASITDRSPAAARQLASRARRRVQQEAPVPDPDVGRQRRVVDAFAAAAQEGDFDALMSVLDPAIVLRADAGPERPDESVVVRGAQAVAGRAVGFAQLTPHARPALINGAVGAVVIIGGRPTAVMGFTVTDGRIAEIDILSDPARLAALDLAGVS